MRQSLFNPRFSMAIPPHHRLIQTNCFEGVTLVRLSLLIEVIKSSTSLHCDTAEFEELLWVEPTENVLHVKALKWQPVDTKTKILYVFRRPNSRTKISPGLKIESSTKRSIHQQLEHCGSVTELYTQKTKLMVHPLIHECKWSIRSVGRNKSKDLQFCSPPFSDSAPPSFILTDHGRWTTGAFTERRTSYFTHKTSYTVMLLTKTSDWSMEGMPLNRCTWKAGCSIWVWSSKWATVTLSIFRIFMKIWVPDSDITVRCSSKEVFARPDSGC